MSPRRNLRQLWAPALSLALLGGLAGSLYSRQPPPFVEEYHERIRALADEIPRNVGSFYGSDTPVPVYAVRLLQPNVMVSRRYESLQSGQSVSLLLVQTRDAWNMNFHYPPVCYRYSGWKLKQEQDHDWEVNGVTLPVREYTFERPGIGAGERIVVANFMFLSSGLGRGMDLIRAAANDPYKRYFGAAQLQVVYSGEIDLPERRSIFQALVAGCTPVVEAVLKGAGS